MLRSRWIIPVILRKQGAKFSANSEAGTLPHDLTGLQAALIYDTTWHSHVHDEVQTAEITMTTYLTESA